MKRAAFLVLFAVFFLLPQGVSASTLEEATVNIYCQYKSGSKIYSSTGSGVFISERGVVLTNAHVVQPFLVVGKKGKCSIRTGSPARNTYTATLLYLSPTWTLERIDELKSKTPRGTGEGDFALLYITGSESGVLPAQFPVVPFDESVFLPLENEAVVLAGYPSGGLSFKKVEKKLTYEEDSTTVEAVRTFSRPYPDVLSLAPSSAGEPGVSGGPVLDSAGVLSAIATAIENTGSKKERSVRAITLFHIDRTLLTEAGTTLRTIIAGDLPTRAATTALGFTDELKKSVTKAIFAKKR